MGNRTKGFFDYVFIRLFSIAVFVRYLLWTESTFLAGKSPCISFSDGRCWGLCLARLGHEAMLLAA